MFEPLTNNRDCSRCAINKLLLLTQSSSYAVFVSIMSLSCPE